MGSRATSKAMRNVLRRFDEGSSLNPSLAKRREASVSERPVMEAISKIVSTQNLRGKKILRKYTQSSMGWKGISALAKRTLTTTR